MKKADICETCNTSPKNCLKCPEYDTCDNCGRRTCVYVAVNVEEDELWCRICCKEMGFSSKEIESQVVYYE